MEEKKAAILWILAGVLIAVLPSHTQSLQQGISVQLPVTNHASAEPEADQKDAPIVTITEDGGAHLGIKPIDSAILKESMTENFSSSNHAGWKLYIKADARAPYQSLARVLFAAHDAGVETAILLTQQNESGAGRTPVPPKGLEIVISGPKRAMNSPRVQATRVQLLISAQQQPWLKINNEDVPWANLQEKLTRTLQNNDERPVLVMADGRLPFAPVAQVIDACRAAGAKVVLGTTQL